MNGSRIGILVLLGVAALLWPGMARAGATVAEKCASSKHKEVGKYLSCREKMEAKAILKRISPDYTSCRACACQQP